MKKRVWSFAAKKNRKAPLKNAVLRTVTIIFAIMQVYIPAVFADSPATQSSDNLLLESKLIVNKEAQSDIAVIPKVLNWTGGDSFVLSFNSADAEFKYIKPVKYGMANIKYEDMQFPYDNGNIVVSSIKANQIEFKISPKAKLNQKKLSGSLGEFVFEMKNSSAEFSFSNESIRSDEEFISATVSVNGEKISICAAAPNKNYNWLGMMITDKENKIFAMDQYPIPKDGTVSINTFLSANAPSGEYFVKLGCRDAAAVKIIKFDYKRPKVSKKIANISANITAGTQSAAICANAENCGSKSIYLDIADALVNDNPAMMFSSEVVPGAKINNMKFAVNASSKAPQYKMTLKVPDTAKLEYSVGCVQASDGTYQISLQTQMSVLEKGAYFKIAVTDDATGEETVYSVNADNYASEGAVPIASGSYTVNVEVYADVQ